MQKFLNTTDRPPGADLDARPRPHLHRAGTETLLVVAAACGLLRAVTPCYLLTCGVFNAGAVASSRQTSFHEAFWSNTWPTTTQRAFLVRPDDVLVVGGLTPDARQATRISSYNSWRTMASRYWAMIGGTPCSRGDVFPP